MNVDRLQTLLQDPEKAATWFADLSLKDAVTAKTNLLEISKSGVPIDLMAAVCGQLEQELPKIADPDMALNNLERFVSKSRSPLSMVALFERDREALPTLLQIFSNSQHLSDLLIRDPESYDLIRLTKGSPISRESLVEDIVAEIDALNDEARVMATLRRFKQRETLRIAYGDIVREQSVAIVTKQISFLADAMVEAAIRYARRTLEEKKGVPRGPNGQPAKLVVLALGKLGGTELNYSSDIDLIMLFDADGNTDGKRSITNQEFFAQIARSLVKLLQEMTPLGAAYRVDFRLRPDGSRGPLAISLAAALTYYDSKGRTWERQAYVKARPIAGDLELGKDFLKTLEPWIYRRFLSRADISGIKALKRRIEERAERQGADVRDVKTGHGGIRDIEFAIQFLQLLNGSDLPEIRTGNTLEALSSLEKTGCLTHTERSILEPNYEMLRKLEHRLQIMFDLQTHTLPTEQAEIGKLAIRMGYAATPHVSPRAAFERDFKQRTTTNRSILDHLLHDAFEDEEKSEPAVDLVNDPEPSTKRIEEILAPYGFSDIPSAYTNLMALAHEPIRFLSTRRCRHFLASIAPRLLSAIQKTSDPDSTLVNLSRISDSLGGKAALWELLSESQPSLKLYVTLCASCPYLASILTSHPGMIDELMDGLVLDTLPTLITLKDSLKTVARGAMDLSPVLHSFKNAQHLRVGVRDILGKDDVQATHRALASVAEACVKRITKYEHKELVQKFGTPTIQVPEDHNLPSEVADYLIKKNGKPCEMIILALGKVGGREPNYHSDLDLVFLYEGEGKTVSTERSMKETTNSHFFSELGQRTIRMVSGMGPHGRLFDIDMRLRPTGRSGVLVVPVAAFIKYFATGGAQLWERQALCKARVIYGSKQATDFAMQAVENAAFAPEWKPENADEIRKMRHRLEKEASKRNLKRGPGGTVDTEFLVQMLQLKYGGEDPTVRVPGTLRAIDALREAGYLSSDDAAFFDKSYRFQRTVEARIRLMNSAGRHELPTEKKELAKLAYLLRYEDPAKLETEALEYFKETRVRFDKIFDAASE